MALQEGRILKPSSFVDVVFPLHVAACVRLVVVGATLNDRSVFYRSQISTHKHFKRALLYSMNSNKQNRFGQNGPIMSRIADAILASEPEHRIQS